MFSIPISLTAQDILGRCAKCKRVDYAKIRSHMAQGISVPGAIMTNRVEYVLSPKEDE